MERFVLLLLVAHFRKLLDTETEAAERRIVQKMLAEAEAELARLELAGQAVTDAGSARLAAPELHYGKLREAAAKSPGSPQRRAAPGGEETSGAKWVPGRPSCAPG